MSTSTKRRKRRNNQPESSLFLEDPKQPAWRQFPEREREEVKRLITRMLIALVVGEEKGGDHE